MKKIIIKYKPSILGLIVGSIGGWLYWKFGGHTGGNSSPAIYTISFNPISIAICGTVLLGIIFTMFKIK